MAVFMLFLIIWIMVVLAVMLLRRGWGTSASDVAQPSGAAAEIGPASQPFPEPPAAAPAGGSGKPGSRTAQLLVRDPEDLSTRELCLAWRLSYPLVQVPGQGLTLGFLAEQRGRYLDELQARDPAGFTRWMQQGARAGSDASRYISMEKQSGSG